jgi:putative addiction module component (TIGR02574 family)
VNLTVDAVRSSFYRNDMTADSREIEKQAQNLPAKERARLALALMESLDQGEDVDAEELWLDEAERRLEDYRAGRVEAIPANEVFEIIAKKLG